MYNLGICFQPTLIQVTSDKNNITATLNSLTSTFAFTLSHLSNAVVQSRVQIKSTDRPQRGHSHLHFTHFAGSLLPGETSSKQLHFLYRWHDQEAATDRICGNYEFHLRAETQIHSAEGWRCLVKTETGFSRTEENNCCFTPTAGNGHNYRVWFPLGLSVLKCEYFQSAALVKMPTDT